MGNTSVEKYGFFIDMIKDSLEKAHRAEAMNPVAILGNSTEARISIFYPEDYQDLMEFSSAVKMEAYRDGSDFSAMAGHGFIVKSDDDKEESIMEYLKHNGQDLSSHPDSEEIAFIHFHTLEGHIGVELANIEAGLYRWEKINPDELNDVDSLMENFLEIRQYPERVYSYNALLEKQGSNQLLH